MATVAAPPGGLRLGRRLTPIGARRLANFKANRRGYVSCVLFLVLFGLSLFAELIANDRPLLVRYEGRFYFPVLVAYPETEFGGFFETEAVYTDPAVKELIRRRAGSSGRRSPTATTRWPRTCPVPHPRRRRARTGSAPTTRRATSWPASSTAFASRSCSASLLTVLSSVVGIAAGAVQGYFGGWVDLGMQRFMEIWSGMPSLYLLIIMSSFIVPGFWTLLILMLLFSWMSLVDLVRAEFLRARNLDFVRAARALGAGNARIMRRHILPNAMVSALTFMPFVLNGSIVALTSLDFLGFGLPPGSPSLGELLSQGRNNLQAPWLGISGFVVIALMLSLLVFAGEAVRDAFDPRKTFR